MSATLKFEGGKELAKALEQLSERISKRILREGLEEAAEPMRRRMGVKAPKGDAEEPNLRDEMVISPARGEDAREVAVAVGPSRRAFYGSFVELGTAYTPARPFARPAFDESTQQSLNILAMAVWRELAGRGISRSTTVGGPVVSGIGGSGTL